MNIDKESGDNVAKKVMSCRGDCRGNRFDMSIDFLNFGFYFGNFVKMESSILGFSTEILVILGNCLFLLFFVSLASVELSVRVGLNDPKHDHGNDDVFFGIFRNLSLSL